MCVPLGRVRLSGIFKNVGMDLNVQNENAWQIGGEPLQDIGGS